jgi:hypothetical protein
MYWMRSGEPSKQRPGKIMVDRLATYCSILERSIIVCDALLALYAPDGALDWASRTLMQTANVRMAWPAGWLSRTWT